jgi:ABC-type nickel/cobalt efflux system permease component RcnA
MVRLLELQHWLYAGSVETLRSARQTGVVGIVPLILLGVRLGRIARALRLGQALELGSAALIALIGAWPLSQSILEYLTIPNCRVEEIAHGQTDP